MIAGGAFPSERATTETFSRVGRAARTILCLAVVAFLAVTLRYGIYAYFHGDGHMLKARSELP
jgi:hypothetical protein